MTINILQIQFIQLSLLCVIHLFLGLFGGVFEKKVKACFVAAVVSVAVHFIIRLELILISLLK